MATATIACTFIRVWEFPVTPPSEESAASARAPTDHLLRRINPIVMRVLADLRKKLAPFYSDIGRPSIDPELMIRMLIVGYCYGIRLCPLKPKCTPNMTLRKIPGDVHEDARDATRALMVTPKFASLSQPRPPA